MIAELMAIANKPSCSPVGVAGGDADPQRDTIRRRKRNFIIVCMNKNAKKGLPKSISQFDCMPLLWGIRPVLVKCFEGRGELKTLGTYTMSE